MYDGSVRVPAIWSMPGTIISGQRVKGLTSLLDLAPTLIELAGAPQLPATDGRSLLPQLVDGEPVNAKLAVFALCGDLKGDMPSAMIRKGAWKLVDHYSYGLPQLFDLENDPRERIDLGGAPECAEVRQALQDELNRVWDGKAVYEHVQHVAAHVRLKRTFNLKTGIQHPDDWYGDPEGNYLLDDASQPTEQP
jgi:choline-sulfatase